MSQPFYNQTPFCDAGPAGRYREHPVHPALEPFVASVWTFESLAPHEHRIIPDGCSNLFFGCCEQSGERVLGIGTPWPHWQKTTQHAGVKCVGVRFKWGGASAFWNLPPMDGQRRFMPLTDFLPKRMHDLSDRLVAANETGARLGILEDTLLQLSPRAWVIDDGLQNAVCTIQQSWGKMRAEDLADWMGYSASQMRRRIIARIGLGPKQLIRVCRVWHAMAKACRHEQVSWGVIAGQLGYYDQAHLIRDFKGLVGLTPTAWLALVRR